jgi:ribosomal protein S27AE
MKTQNVQCPLCGTSFAVGQEIGGKISCALGGAILGSQGMKDPLAMLFFGLIGLVIGHYIDTQLTKTCPGCGQLLKIVGPMFA